MGSRAFRILQLFEDMEEQKGDNEQSLNKYDGFLQELIDGLKLYLDDNDYLFVLIGVFSALSIYLTQVNLPEGEADVSVQDLGMVSGFGIVTVLCLVAFCDLYLRVRRNDSRLISRQNFGYLVFGFLFFFLILTIAVFLISFEEVWAIHGHFMAIMGSFLLYVTIWDILHENGHLDRLSTRLNISKTGAVAIISFSLLLLTMFVQLFLEMSGMAIPAESIGDSEVMVEQLPIIILTTFNSFWMMLSLLILIISVPYIILGHSINFLKSALVALVIRLEEFQS